jgi:hypothetical protein
LTPSNGWSQENMELAGQYSRSTSCSSYWSNFSSGCKRGRELKTTFLDASRAEVQDILRLLERQNHRQ